MRLFKKLKSKNLIKLSGVFFEMMTTDMRKKLPSTIDDLYTQNFTIVYPEYFASDLKDLHDFIPERRR